MRTCSHMFVFLLALILVFSTVYAEDYDLSGLTTAELEALRTRIEEELAENHSVSSYDLYSVLRIILDRTAAELKLDYADITFQEESFSCVRDKELFTVEAMVAYSRNNQHQSSALYAQVVKANGGFEIVQLTVDGQALVSADQPNVQSKAITTSSPTEVPVSEPEPVSGLKASEKAPNRVTLTWNDNQQDAIYAVYWRLSGTESWSKPQYTKYKNASISDLKPGESYDFRVIVEIDGSKSKGKLLKNVRTASPTPVPTATPRPTATPKPTATPRPTATPKPKDSYGIGESVTYNGVTYTATGYRQSKGSSWNKPDAGNIYVLVSFQIENNSRDSLSLSTILSFDCYCDDYSVDYSFGALMEAKNTLDVTIEPGKKARGEFGVEVPSNWSNIEIRLTPGWFENTLTFFIDR